MKYPRLIQSRLLCLIAVLLCFLSGCSNDDSVTYNYVAFEFVNSKCYAIQNFSGKVDTLQIPSQYDGYPVTYILEGVFYGCHMKELRMETIENIYEEAFENCRSLSNVDLGTVEIIGVRAFSGCISLKTITIPDTVVRLETEAFLRCTNLESVYFEGSPEYIGADVFEQNVIIYGPVGSLVEEYAKSNGLEFRSWEPATN